MDGGFDRIATKKRPGTVAICAAIQNKYNIDAVPHLICGGFTKEDTENALIDLHFLGIDNVLALRGDALRAERSFIPEEGGNSNALDLIHQIKNMNSGVYLDEELINAHVTDFCVGSAGYPEKHADAPNKHADMKFLKRKVEAGAEFIITQMFFDNKSFFEFVESCKANDIHVPIIPGIKPIATKKQLQMLPNIFNIEIPVELSNQVEACEDNKAVREVGIQWAIKQCKELIEAKAPVLHFYTMGKVATTKAICSEIY